MERHPDLFNFCGADKIMVNDDFVSTYSPDGRINSTVTQMAPYIEDLRLRLVLPRVIITVFGQTMEIATVSFGQAWTENKICRRMGVSSHPIQMWQAMEQTVIDLQTKNFVADQLLKQAKMFKQKSDAMSPFGVCPPVGEILEIDKVYVELGFWPRTASIGRVQNGLKIEMDVQLTAEFFNKFGVIYAVEVQDARDLPRGGWVLEDGKYVHPKIKITDKMEVNDVNIINGYFIDWELYHWEV
jgi:hypothetical protein